ncbi:hypothetical protein PEKONANI_01007 [Aeromonas jandaei]
MAACFFREVAPGDDRSDPLVKALLNSVIRWQSGKMTVKHHSRSARNGAIFHVILKTPD